MPQLLYFGLLLALTASPLLLYLYKRVHINSFSLAPRLTLWALAIVVLIISALKTEMWRSYLGLLWPSWQNLGLAIFAVFITLLVFVVHHNLQQKLGANSSEKHQQFQGFMSFSFSYRIFLVVTAAVTEEVLYRGYAIGIGQHLLGSVWLAYVASVVAFTLPHIRWGLSHLVPVFITALVFTILFAYTQNLWACIFAHAIVDAIGFLVIPAVMTSKHRTPVAHEG